MPVTHKQPRPPRAIAERLPPAELLSTMLTQSAIELAAGHTFFRGAWNLSAVWPVKPSRPHRFGPPEALINAEGKSSFSWWYAADDVFTAVWEAGFCVNDVTRPGTFQLAHGAEHTLIATLEFARSLRLFDLCGTSSSKLGIYDELRSPDYQFSQWLGWQLDALIGASRLAIVGFRYPSRRHPGAIAYAISSRAMRRLVRGMSVVTEQFATSRVYARLVADPCYVLPA